MELMNPIITLPGNLAFWLQLHRNEARGWEIRAKIESSLLVIAPKAHDPGQVKSWQAGNLCKIKVIFVPDRMSTQTKRC